MTGESENKSDFSCDISIGDDFIFRVKHSEDKRNTSDKDEMRKKKKPRNKYISPSTKRRNAARLLAYKAKRAEMGGKGPTRSGDPLPPPNLDATGGVDEVGARLAGRFENIVKC